jgi:hypothetical protein
MEKEFRESPLDKDKKAMRLFIPHGSAVKIRIIRLFNKYDLKMLSYKDGTVKSPDPKASHPLKIGAILTNLVSNSGITKKFGIVLDNNEDKKEATELLRLFAKDSANRNIDDGIVDIDPREEPKWIVISRDPYDVAGMSTGREWSSCQDLEGGGYCHYVPRDILAGTLAAYLIKDSDKREVVRDGDVLRLPLSRLLIKPYLNNKGETAFAMSAKQYTKNNRDPIFPIVVKKWVDEFNRKRGTKGFFIIHPAVYMGHEGGTGEISATEFEIDDEGNMVNAGNPGYYKPDIFIRNVEEEWTLDSDNIFEIFENEARFNAWSIDAVEMTIEDPSLLHEFINEYYLYLTINTGMSRGLAFREIFTETSYSSEMMNGNVDIIEAMVDLYKRKGLSQARDLYMDEFDIDAKGLAVVAKRRHELSILGMNFESVTFYLASYPRDFHELLRFFGPAMTDIIAEAVEIIVREKTLRDSAKILNDLLWDIDETRISEYASDFINDFLYNAMAEIEPLEDDNYEAVYRFKKIVGDFEDIEKMNMNMRDEINAWKKDNNFLVPLEDKE